MLSNVFLMTVTDVYSIVQVDHLKAPVLEWLPPNQNSPPPDKQMQIKTFDSCRNTCEGCTLKDGIVFSRGSSHVEVMLCRIQRTLNQFYDNISVFCTFSVGYTFALYVCVL